MDRFLPARRSWTMPQVGRNVLVGLIAAGFWLGSAIIVAVPATATAGVNLSVGESATQDILAPIPISYPSQVLTDRAREAAGAAVPDFYDSTDTRVARQQVLVLRDVLNYISSVRADTFATPEQKLADLQAINGIHLTPDDARQITGFDNSSWTNVQAEALNVLEQILRGQLKENQVEDVRRSVPARVSVNLSEAQVQVVAALVSDLITANSFYNEAATQAAREAARAAVEPVYRQIVRGQAVVVRGQVVTAEDIEALQALGLLQPKAGWREPVSGLLLTLVSGLLLALYIRRFNPDFAAAPRRVLLLSLLITSFLLAARLMVPGRTVLPFLFPAAALSMLLTVFAGPNLAMVVAVVLGALVGYIGGNNLELALYSSLGGILAALAVGRGERLNQFFWAGLAVATVNVGVLLVFGLQNATLDPFGLLQLMAAGLVNGAVSASLTLAGFFVLGGLFDITTSLQLVELARPDHPLLRYILRNAPGTYQHSLQVSNLAEQAAERIGANAMLTRVGALYHDAGKTLHPQFFVENQLDGNNIHDTLTPDESARIIINHIADGLEMARRHRLPSSVRAFIPEHHGTLRTMYQYTRALQAAGGDATQVDAGLYSYPGPRPQSKETALLMLADGCEARARSQRPKSEADIDVIVKSVIDDRLANGQLDDTDLSLHDLQLIRESFVSTLKGVFHPRIAYPGQVTAAPVPPALEAPAPTPALPAPEKPA